MKKFKQLLFVTSLSLGMMITPIGAEAVTYKVKNGDSFWKISQNCNIPIEAIKKVNNRKSNTLYAGELIELPKAISKQDKQLMARLVHAEAKGEPYAGKVAVATVILNRLDHEDFPNTIKGVIYERSPGGYYAFSPVENGTINEPANAEAMKAVNEAIAFRGQGRGSLYFYNPETSTSEWILSREETITIGNHRFAK